VTSRLFERVRGAVSGRRGAGRMLRSGHSLTDPEKVRFAEHLLDVRRRTEMEISEALGVRHSSLFAF
jgi:hypothetical protein